MINKTTRYRKPDLLTLLAVFVGIGFLATSLAQASESNSFDTFVLSPEQPATDTERWWQSVWGLDLARKLKNWRPPVTVHDTNEGLSLARPFGNTGPSLQFSSSLPDSVQRSLREGGDSGIGAFGSDTDAYLFLHKRW